MIDELTEQASKLYDAAETHSQIITGQSLREDGEKPSNPVDQIEEVRFYLQNTI